MLRRNFELELHTFVAILKYNQKSCTFVAFLYQKDEIFRKYHIPPWKEIFGKKLCATGRNFLSQGNVSSDRKILPVK